MLMDCFAIGYEEHSHLVLALLGQALDPVRNKTPLSLIHYINAMLLAISS